MSERANPFGDLNDLAATSAPKPRVDRSVIDQVAEANGFQSRQPVKQPESVQASRPDVAPQARKQRRFTTGRNQQINIKATAETIERMGRMADDRGVPLGRLLELALDALEKDIG